MITLSLYVVLLQQNLDGGWTGVGGDDGGWKRKKGGWTMVSNTP